MQFYVSRGLEGIHLFYGALGKEPGEGFMLMKEILAAGPVGGRRSLAGLNLESRKGLKAHEDWLKFFFPEESPPGQRSREGGCPVLVPPTRAT